MVRLGGNPFNSFDEGNVTGSNIQLVRVAANLWPTVRDAMLRDHLWNCCIKRERLSADVTPPPFGWTARFAIPSDWVRTIEALDAGGVRTRYRSEGRYLLADTGVIDLVYVFKNTIPETWDTALVQAMELAMMCALCYPVTKSTSLKTELEASLYGPGGYLARARAIDGQDDPEQEFGDNPMRQSRYNGWGAGPWGPR